MRLAFHICVLLAVIAPMASAGVVSFTGKAYQDSGSPLANALVVPGTFAPSFDAFAYTHAYGDESGNLNSYAYDQAVADGAFVPGGAGVLTDANGNFAWNGNLAASAGQRLWFFVFENGDTNAFFQVLATSDSPNWLMPSDPGATAIVASEADRFVMGQKFADGVATSVIPFPEPASWTLGLALFGLIRRRGGKDAPAATV